MKDCIFCNIISGNIPASSIYEDDEFKIILDRFPASPGHCLILPKKHFENIFDIDPEISGRLFCLAAKTARELKKSLGFSDMNVLQNNGPLAGQTVNHFHLHLIPRYPGDNISVKWNPLSPKDTEIASMREKILKSFNI